MTIPATRDSVVYVSGSFDNLRTIDIRFLQESSRLGDVHVLLYSDDLAKIANDQVAKFPLAERLYFLKNIRFVKNVQVIESFEKNAIPISEKVKDGNQFYWTVREKNSDDISSTYCKKFSIKQTLIPDSTLEGFPLQEDIHQLSQKKVMVSGCFDWVHSGHVRFFEEAAEFGDLYVVIGHDENLRLLKGEGHPLFSQTERQYWVHAVQFVHRALISSGKGWLDAEPEVMKYKPDIFVVNEDGDKPEKRQLFKNLGIEYLVLKRTPKEGLEARQSTHLRGF